jgi:pimeloyl-ACP methyl ester carboxylesterase
MPERLQQGLQRANVANVELRYLRIGTGRPVVLLHTLRTQLDYFGSVLEQLAATRLEVIAVDLPGHGHSSAPSVDYSAKYFTDTVEHLLEHCGLRAATLVGESIGATIALALAARGNARVNRVIALNPYDYGRWGGIRRSSPLAYALFTALLWPGIGPLVAREETRAILRRVLHGGLYDRGALREDLLEELYRCGSLPGHARAFRSLNRQWHSWIAAREGYSRVAVPVTLVYGDHDWSCPDERIANARLIPSVKMASLDGTGDTLTETPIESGQGSKVATGLLQDPRADRHDRTNQRWSGQLAASPGGAPERWLDACQPLSGRARVAAVVVGRVRLKHRLRYRGWLLHLAWSRVAGQYRLTAVSQAHGPARHCTHALAVDLDRAL